MADHEGQGCDCDEDGEDYQNVSGGLLNLDALGEVVVFVDFLLFFGPQEGQDNVRKDNDRAQRAGNDHVGLVLRGTLDGRVETEPQHFGEDENAFEVPDQLVDEESEVSV